MSWPVLRSAVGGGLDKVIRSYTLESIITISSPGDPQVPPTLAVLTSYLHLKCSLAFLEDTETVTLIIHVISCSPIRAQYENEIILIHKKFWHDTHNALVNTLLR